MAGSEVRGAVKVKAPRGGLGSTMEATCVSLADMVYTQAQWRDKRPAGQSDAIPSDASGGEIVALKHGTGGNET